MTVLLCASCPGPQGMSQGWAPPLPLGCGRWAHTSVLGLRTLLSRCSPRVQGSQDLSGAGRWGCRGSGQRGRRGHQHQAAPCSATCKPLTPSPDSGRKATLGEEQCGPWCRLKTRGCRGPAPALEGLCQKVDRTQCAFPVVQLCADHGPDGFGPRWTCRRLGCLPWCPHRFGERGILPGKRRTLGQAGARLGGVLGLVLALGRPGRHLSQDELPFHMSLRPGCSGVRAIASQVQVEEGESG